MRAWGVPPVIIILKWYPPIKQPRGVINPGLTLAMSMLGTSSWPNPSHLSGLQHLLPKLSHRYPPARQGTPQRRCQQRQAQNKDAQDAKDGKGWEAWRTQILTFGGAWHRFHVLHPAMPRMPQGQLGATLGVLHKVAKHKDKIETINLFIPIIPYYFDGDDRNHWNHQQTDIKSCHIKKNIKNPIIQNSLMKVSLELGDPRIILNSDVGGKICTMCTKPRV